MSTGMFKWTPEFTIASSAYGRAGDAYLRAGDIESAIKAFEQSADASTKDGRPQGAAVVLDKAAKAVERGEARDGKRLADLWDRVSAAFVAAPDVVRAAEAKASAAKAVSAVDPERGERSFMEACALFEAVPDRPMYATRPLREGVNLLVQHGRHRGAMELLKKLMGFYKKCDQVSNIHAAILSRVILLLHAGDAVAARSEFDAGMSVDGFLTSKEGAAADDLLGVSVRLVMLRFVVPRWIAGFCVDGPVSSARSHLDSSVRLSGPRDQHSCTHARSNRRRGR
jgi:tetratricopeptide (TPR) repeat protein